MKRHILKTKCRLEMGKLDHKTHGANHKL